MEVNKTICALFIMLFCWMSWESREYLARPHVFNLFNNTPDNMDRRFIEERRPSNTHTPVVEWAFQNKKQDISSCKRQIADWVHENTDGFWVQVQTPSALKILEAKLPAIVVAEPIVLMDIGGAEYGGGSDKSDASVMLASFSAAGVRVQIHVFDMQDSEILKLKQALLSRHSVEDMKQVTAHTMGISSSNGFGIVCRNSWNNQWFLADSTRPCDEANVATKVPMTSLAQFCQDNAISNVAYVKVDVEGGEKQVFEGMKSMMALGAVQLVSFEYALNWHDTFKLGTQKERREKLGLTAECIDAKSICWEQEVRAFDQAPNSSSLWRFTQQLEAIGWDMYMLHNNLSKITLVPISGDFWDPIFELGLHYNDPPFKHQWHWTDLFAVKSASAAKAALFREFPNPFSECMAMY